MDSAKILGVKSKSPDPSTFEQAFGNAVLAWRRKRGWSQMDLAVASGYSLRYIGDIERGAKSATMRTMHDLAILLDVKLSALMAETEELWECDSKARARSPKSRH
jgi:transcriptional regulator with XRE-family HTH domain